MQMEAPAEAVFELARDVSRWAEQLPHYLRSAVLARRDDRVLVQFVAVRRFGHAPVPVTWRALCWSDGTDATDLRLHFAHVRGVTRGMRVTWHIQPLPGDAARTRVTIEHDFQLPLRLLGTDALPRIVDRFFTVPIATRTLRRFRALAEGRRNTGGHPADPSATNMTS
jgi:ribosome-associated toxin RatA of RatAB toxin-antitoxin module